jgi:hypothetical protein
MIAPSIGSALQSAEPYLLPAAYRVTGIDCELRRERSCVLSLELYALDFKSGARGGATMGATKMSIEELTI